MSISIGIADNFGRQYQNECRRYFLELEILDTNTFTNFLKLQIFKIIYFLNQ